MRLTATIILATCSRASFPLFSVILPSIEGETVLAGNVTIDYRYDGSCLMMEAKSALAVVGDFRCSEESTAFLAYVGDSLLLWWQNGRLPLGQKAL